MMEPGSQLSGGSSRSRRAERWRERCGTGSGSHLPRETSGRRRANETLEIHPS